MMNVTWYKSGFGWFPLDDTNIQQVVGDGVYIIKRGGFILADQTVYVGKGDISSRLRVRNSDPRVTQYRAGFGLYFTWTNLAHFYQEGVERYLADTLNPLVGERYPDVTPIPVNLPD